MADDNMTPIERLATRTLNDAYQANKRYWSKIHRKQERLYKSVRNFNRRRKAAGTSSYNRTYSTKRSRRSRSNIQIGTMWMLHNIAYSIVTKALLDADDLMKLEPRRGQSPAPYLQEMSDHAEDLFTDDISDIKNTVSKALWDALAMGPGVLVASWQDVLKRTINRVRDAEGEERIIDNEVNYGGYPHFDHFSPWDTFPTAGAVNPASVHEVIFKSTMTISELREWERKGLINNVDTMISQLQKDGYLPDEGVYEADESRSGTDNFAGQESVNGQISILTSYCLFPFYRYDEYVDNDGRDRSKDEVECIIIKAENADQILLLDRNPFACQEKPWILAGWYFIPGEFWPISVFEITEKLIQHYEDIFNLIQDGANAEIYPMKILPNQGIDEGEVSGDVGITIHMDPNYIREGMIPQYIKRPNSILPEMYNQRDFVNDLIQEVTAIVDFVRGMTPQGPKRTATETLEISQRVNARFQQSAIKIEASLMKPVWNWIMVMMSEFSDDRQVMNEMGLEINPYKQFAPIMPNPAYRIKLTGALRAAESQANQAKLTSMIELSKGIMPMPDPESNGQYIVPNTVLMLFDLMQMSGLPNVDKYKLVVPNPGEEAQDEPNQGDLGFLTGAD